jgi:hypothetical protein
VDSGSCARCLRRLQQCPSDWLTASLLEPSIEPVRLASRTGDGGQGQRRGGQPRPLGLPGRPPGLELEVFG